VGVSVLLGTHSYQLDAKGRISLPAKFRERLDEGAYLTLGQDGCLWVFPQSEFDRVSDEVDAASMGSPEGRAYSRIFFGSADDVKPDGQGRLTIPLRLRQLAGIEREAVVIGVRDRIEVWDRSTWERYSDQFGGAYQTGAISPGGRTV
jgi:transcriptional regulator MraZ